MRKTLLEIANEIAILGHFDQFQSLIGNEDSNAQLILTCIKNGTERDVYRGHAWADLRRFYSFVEVDEQASYSLPADFGYYINETAWEISEKKRLVGPLDPIDWQVQTLEDTGRETAFIFAGANAQWSPGTVNQNQSYTKKMHIHPTPSFEGTTGTKRYTIAYISNEYVIDENGRPKTAFAYDTDSPIIDCECVQLAAICRLKRSLGLTFADEFDELQKLLSDWARKEGGMKRIRTDTTSKVKFHANIPNSGFGP